MRKKIVIISFLIFILLVVLIICLNIKSNKQVKANINNNGIAIMIENEQGKYQLYTGENGMWPGEEYAVDALKSDCTIIDDSIGWDNLSHSVLFTTKNSSKCTLYFTKKQRNFSYTGAPQEFIAPVTGTYKIELWGASGLYGHVATEGKGAYTTGNIVLSKGEKVYIYVGGNNPSDRMQRFTFNGGGGGEATGGGATDIRLINGNWDSFDSLKSRIMVAAGGGGGVSNTEYNEDSSNRRGDAGTLHGFDAHWLMQGYFEYSGHGATQVSGGKPGSKFQPPIDPEETPEMSGSFGKGGYSTNMREGDQYQFPMASGGGGGYYGGGHGNHPGHAWGGGGGGSSYISGYLGCVAIKQESTENSIQPKDECTEESAKTDITCSYHYSNKIFTSTNMIAGNAEMPSPTGETEIGHTGNGYAKITLVG